MRSVTADIEGTPMTSRLRRPSQATHRMRRRVVYECRAPPSSILAMRALGPEPMNRLCAWASAHGASLRCLPHCRGCHSIRSGGLSALSWYPSTVWSCGNDVATTCVTHRGKAWLFARAKTPKALFANAPSALSHMAR